SWLVALIAASVVSGVAYLEVRSHVGGVDRELTEAAQLTAEGVAENLGARQLDDPVDIRGTLHDFVQVNPLVDTISVIEVDPAGRLRVLTSTSTEERAEAIALA